VRLRATRYLYKRSLPSKQIISNAGFSVTLLSLVES
jgi:hypothetical protein